MIYSILKTVYIDSDTDSNLLRYDVIRIDSDTYRVKVFDNQQHALSTPDLIHQVTEFTLTRADYNKKYQVGNIGSVRRSSPPGFENTIDDELQAHRDNLS